MKATRTKTTTRNQTQSTVLEQLKFIAETGTFVPQYELITKYLLNPQSAEYDKTMGLQHLERIANEGFVKAQEHLGRLYEGEKVNRKQLISPPDYAMALHWYKKAESKLPVAKYHIGQLHMKGLGVPKDPITAVKWYFEAAEQDSHLAQYALGLCYLTGNGAGMSVEKAYDWLTRASENGSRGAIRLLNNDPRLFRHIEDTQLAPLQKKATEKRVSRKR